MQERTFDVTGMTCEHCVRAVRAEVSSVPGVDEVAVDLGAGTMRVRCTDATTVEAILAAVREAGYDGAPAD